MASRPAEVGRLTAPHAVREAEGNVPQPRRNADITKQLRKYEGSHEDPRLPNELYFHVS